VLGSALEVEIKLISETVDDQRISPSREIRIKGERCATTASLYLEPPEWR
jgi:hypothetical protein